mgnify:CR=1 FL=1
MEKPSMGNLKDKVNAEIENIEETLKELPDSPKLPYLTILELAGVATLLHNYYNGIENILKQILKHQNIKIPQGSSWHKDLLNLSERYNIISLETKQNLIEYLAFRHFFNHSYALDLYSTKMEPLVENVHDNFNHFKREITTKLQS